MTNATSPPTPLQDGEGGRKVPLRSVMSSDVVGHQYVSDYKKKRARELRRDCTEAEQILWARLRNRQVNGFKFRRQQVISGFVADFYCDETRLVIEVDGSIHELENVKKRDVLKENVFIDRGLFVLRFKNEQVVSEIETVINEIRSISRKRLGT
jgi:very-short-patch-repair endonuclease